MYELKFLWRHSTLTIPSLIARRQSIAASIHKLPGSVVKSVSRASHRVNVSGETIRLSTSLRLTVDFCIYTQKSMHMHIYVYVCIFLCAYIYIYIYTHTRARACAHKNDKQTLVFHFIFDLLWTGRGSSVSFLALVGFRELKATEKHGCRLSQPFEA